MKMPIRYGITALAKSNTLTSQTLETAYRLMPTGGVASDNVKEWFAAGAVALGVGGSLTAGAKTGDYAAVTAAAKLFVAKIREARNA